MSSASRKRLEFVDIFYAFSIIQVIFVHARMMRIDNTDLIKSIVDFIDDYHMALFFFLAGVLLSYTDYRHPDLKAWYGEKVKKLLFPFLSLTFLAYIPKILLEPILGNGASFSLTYLLRVILVPRKTIWGHFWFIPVYLIVILLSKLYIRQKKNKVIYYGILIISCVLNLYPLHTEWFGISDICKFTFYVLLGVTVEPFITNIYDEFVQKHSWALSVGLIILATVSYVFADYLIVMKIHILIMIMLVMTLSMILQNNELKRFRAIGKHNLVIYIYSWPVQSVIEIGMTRFSGINYYIIFCTKFVFGLCIPILLKLLADRFIKNKKLKEIIGL